MLKILPFYLYMALICSGCEAVPSAVSETEDAPKEIAAAPAAKIQEKPSKNKAFAPSFKSEQKDIYLDAAAIYSSSPKVPSGVYPYKELVFVVIEIDTNKEDIEYREGTAMLRANAYLREKYPNLPTQFKVRNRLVEKSFDDESGIYRYALAYRLADIMRLRKSE